MRSVLAAFLGAAVGCASSSVVVRPLTVRDEAELNEAVDSRVANVKLEGIPGEVRGTNLHLAASTLRFQEADPESPWPLTLWLPAREVDIASVRSIAVRDRSRGAWHGLAFGGGIGTVIGVVAAVTLPARAGADGPVRFGPETAVYGAVAGALIGALVGAAVGAPKTIEFRDAPAR